MITIPQMPIRNHTDFRCIDESLCYNHFERVKQEVSKYFKIPVKVLESKEKSREVVEARHIAFWILRNTFECTLPKIGRSFNRDHATVMHGLDKISGMLSVYPEMMEALTTIKLACCDSGRD